MLDFQVVKMQMENSFEIRFPLESDYENLKALWQTAFDDTKESLDYFFKNTISPERVLAVFDGSVPVSALYNRKLRIPALFLVLNSVQCIGQQFMGWPKLHWFILAGINILIYFCFSAQYLGGLYAEYKEKEKAAC